LPLRSLGEQFPPLRRSVPVADKWTSELGKDYCDLCSAKRRVEAQKKMAERDKKRSGDE
jgi:hypothetical protein